MNSAPAQNGGSVSVLPDLPVTQHFVMLPVGVCPRHDLGPVQVNGLPEVTVGPWLR